MNKAVKLLLVMLVSVPLAYSSADTTDIGDDRSLNATVTDKEQPICQDDSVDSPSNPDEESTSSKPAPLPSLADRLVTDSSPDRVARMLQHSKHRCLMGMRFVPQPNNFSLGIGPRQKTLLRLSRIPSGNMALLATLDQAQAPPLS